jgi:SRSO17 transposase
MHEELEMAAQARLQGFLAELGGRCLKNRLKRESFALYALGLLSGCERKSAEPMAELFGTDPLSVQHMHDKLLHFVSGCQWDDRAVRQYAARYAISELEQREPVTTWIVDDTGFLKQGQHSVGVQRQYTGSAGKITNCQLGVSLCVATSTAQLPIDFELYLPEKWATDPSLRRRGKIPDSVTFKTKTELALDMIERAVRAELPGEIVLADAAFGDSTEFRITVEVLGLDYAVGVSKSITVHRVDAAGRARGAAISAKALAESPELRFRRVTWRTGTKEELSARFCFVRVKTAHDDGMPLSARKTEWLIVEWRDSEPEPSKFHLTTLPARMSKKAIVRLLKERWRTERMYEDLKGELGLDHFEGRSYPGWHHHVSMVLCCAAFLTSEQARAFSPQRARSASAAANPGTPGAALCPLDDDAASGFRQSRARLAPPMPALPARSLRRLSA